MKMQRRSIKFRIHFFGVNTTTTSPIVYVVNWLKTKDRGGNIFIPLNDKVNIYPVKNCN